MEGNLGKCEFGGAKEPSQILSLPSSSAAEAHIVTENSPSSVLMETLFCCHVCVRWLVMAPAAAADETGIDAPLMAKSCG